MQSRNREANEERQENLREVSEVSIQKLDENKLETDSSMFKNKVGTSSQVLERCRAQWQKQEQRWK